MSVAEPLTLDLSPAQQNDVLAAIESLMANVDTREQAERLGDVANRILTAQGQPARSWWEA
ncbi:hypothetical protein ACFQDE_20995 [Deinococcus caeni]|uniref:Uncharacterized protein n=1 Tax=Deinococcus caeni TaxID=569127 RepID=A0ABP9UGC4_9DEIO